MTRPAVSARSVVRGSAALGIRQLLTLLATFLGGVGFARLMTPAEVGGIVGLTLVAGLSRALVDGGLAASLVQQDDQPTTDETNRVFTAQMWIAAVLCLSIVGVALVMEVADPHSRMSDPIAVAALSVLPMALTSSAMAVMERGMAFGRLSLTMSIHPFVFYGGGVLVVALGGGLTALAVVLVVSQTATGVGCVLMSGWRPALRRPDAHVRRRVRFGGPLIAGTLASVLKDAVNPVALGLLLGAAAVGYINVAQQIAAVGTYLLFAMARVYLPVFSRLREEPERLSQYVEAACYWANVVVAPLSCFAALNAAPILRVVYGPAWEPAASTLRLLVVATLVAPSTAVLMWLLNSRGRTDVTLAYALVWFLLTWALVPPLSAPLGLMGYGVANILVSTTFVGMLIQTRDVLAVRGFLRAMTPWASAAVALAVSTLAGAALGIRDSVIGLAAVGLTGGLAFLLLLVLFDRRRFSEGARHLWH